MSTLEVLGLLTIIGGVLGVLTKNYPVGLVAILNGMILYVVGRTGSTASKIDNEVKEINRKMDTLLEWIRVNQSKGIGNIQDRDKLNIVGRGEGERY